MPLYESGDIRYVKVGWLRRFWTKRITKHLKDYAIVFNLMFVNFFHSSGRIRPGEYRQVLENKFAIVRLKTAV